IANVDGPPARRTDSAPGAGPRLPALAGSPPPRSALAARPEAAPRADGREAVSVPDPCRLGGEERKVERIPMIDSPVIVTTANSLEGYEIAEHLGVVRGIVVRAPTIGQGIRGAFSSIFGGNIAAYEEVCEKARSEACIRMVTHAEERGADAVIAMRYDATEFSSGITEVLA